MYELKVKRLYDDAMLPDKKVLTDEGWDLFVHSVHFDNDGAIVYGSGIAIELNEGYVADLRCRSSISKYDIVLTNAIGTIDAGYRGEIMAKFKIAPRFNEEGNVDMSQVKAYIRGDRFAQLVIRKSEQGTIREVDKLTPTQRGANGYGSTGR